MNVCREHQPGGRGHGMVRGRKWRAAWVRALGEWKVHDLRCTGRGQRFLPDSSADAGTVFSLTGGLSAFLETSEIVATVPAGASSGLVTVTTSSGTVTRNGSFRAR